MSGLPIVANRAVKDGKVLFLMGFFRIGESRSGSPAQYGDQAMVSRDRRTVILGGLGVLMAAPAIA